MKVKELMTANPKVCTSIDSLAKVATIMWEIDCGIVPVITEDGKVVGLVTDRDICMAANFENRNLSNIAVEDIISNKVFDCRPDDDVRTALKTMQEHKVHRLPVVAGDGTLEGLLSLNDIVRKAEDPREKKAPELSYSDVVNTYKSICQHRAKIAEAASAS